jgi:nuclear pore complex protein Nup98-Nup96
MTRLPELIQDAGALLEGSHVVELEELARSVPRLIGLLPTIFRDPADARHSVAVATMITRLTRQLDKAMPSALVSWQFLSIVEFFWGLFQSFKQLRNLPVDEAIKLHHARTIMQSQFLKTVEAS